MCQLSPQGYPRTGARVAVARNRTGRVQAFLTVVPAGGRGWLLDLIARTAETPRDEC